MRFFYTIKFFFKGLKSNLLLNLFSFLILPLGLSWLFGMMGKMEFQNPNIVEVTPIVMTDKDNSTYSKSLVNFIENDLNTLFKITNKDENVDLEIVIPNNYEESILNNKSSNIEIKELTTRGQLSSLMKNILDDYHQNLYYKNTSSSFIESTTIDSEIKTTSTEYFAVSFLGFLGIMFIMFMSNGEYLSESNGIKKRYQSMPISRCTQLIYEFISSILYFLIFILLYLLSFRCFNISFTGNLFTLILLAVITSIFIASISSFLGVFFSKKYGLIIVYTLMMAVFVLGGIITPFVDALASLSKLSPLYLITNLFTKFNIYNSFEHLLNPIIIILAMSITLLIASLLKEKYSWREF
ncbi:ABC transporter permease [Clostridium sp. CCUG 7971]|uniref:ABC transporter permease n=1 Tax=Clostridium sp. CCUG 7971 TaxID=2811414 RepID=UPI001ABBDE9F|nr:ABC transporter permease [Clostridium sp. CCUG 7971]MBO3443610.1 ABC transporter permease [Clostridium sp. CCUG 7971]